VGRYGNFSCFLHKIRPLGWNVKESVVLKNVSKKKVVLKALQVNPESASSSPHLYFCSFPKTPCWIILESYQSQMCNRMWNRETLRLLPALVFCWEKQQCGFKLTQ